MLCFVLALSDNNVLPSASDRCTPVFAALLRLLLVHDHKRLTQVVEERNLVAEEQRGFRRRRGCRDQLLTLILLGQLKAILKRENCGSVWKVWEWEVVYVPF